MMKIIVLGAGMVGRAIAFDLSNQHDVTSVDINKTNLDKVETYGVKTLTANLSQYEIIPKLVENFDLVVSCAPGFMGFRTIEAVIKAQKNIVDISFMPEDFMLLNGLAVKNKVSVITDCGVAPGMPNLFLGYHNKRMQVTDFFYMVGGLPKARNYPFQYKAPFSPIDVLEEYTRPARYKENGILLTKDALSEPQLYRFAEVGDLEGFNTDGLRSLLKTMEHIPNMKEKTLRYPGHIDLIQALKSTGFFSNESINVGNTSIIPMEVTTKILFSDWELKPNEPEFTVMRVEIKGVENGKNKTITYDLFDEYDPASQQWSMARTTGYTATAAVNLMVTKKFTKAGVFPLELVGDNEDCFKSVMDYLSERNVIYRKTEA
ncbi:MAG: saccharopine dehydrogenase [Bacteroidetes bacterium HGW-Bacteroidetes-15]|nr:MAG: saccharopine dehydrogenase [Bacteroidetes bacterium HGW-Bacteroidetes-15]